MRRTLLTVTMLFGLAQVAMAQAIKVVSIVGAKTTMTVGQTVNMQVLARSANGKPVTKPITWGVSNTTVASITDAGVITALAPGNTNVIAIVDRVSGSWPITVVAKQVPLVSCAITTPTVMPCMDTVRANLSYGLAIGDTSRATSPVYPCYTVAPAKGAMVSGQPCDTTKSPPPGQALPPARKKP